MRYQYYAKNIIKTESIGKRAIKQNTGLYTNA
jgi:hypothetical protein